MSNSSSKWMITLTVMICTIIEMLDMTIIIVAMSNMMGAFSTTQNQITWIVTAYIVSSAIVILLTGFLVRFFGHKRLLLIATVGFMFSSLACGLSVSLVEMVIFRLLQGLFGAVFVPISQYVLHDTFSREEQGMAMSIWGMGIMLAPILGPVVGGYITDTWSWRWVFFINVPFCIIAFILILRYIQDSPVIRSAIPWLSISFLITGIGSLQMMLDRGNQEGWFNSKFIIILAVLAIIGILCFIYRCLTENNPVVNLRVFANSSFSISSFMLSLYFAAIFGVITLQPLMLQTLMGYTSFSAGLVSIPRGIASFVGMFLAGLFLKRLDARWFIFAGIVLSFYGTYIMSQFYITMGAIPIRISAAIQGLGMGLTLVPLSTLCISTLAKEDIPGAAGLFSFARNLGNAIGISALSTILTQNTQMNWHILGSHLQSFKPALQQWFAALSPILSAGAQKTLLAQTLANQASMIAFNKVNELAWICLLCLLLFIPFLKKTKITEIILD